MFWVKRNLIKASSILESIRDILILNERNMANPEDIEDTSIIDDGTHELRRENLSWGVNYTKDMVRLPKTQFKLLKDIETDHIVAIIKYFKDLNRELNPDYLKYFKYRIKNEKKTKISNWWIWKYN